MFIVNIAITSTERELPLKVDYLVRKYDQDGEIKYLIGDVITEGISMLNSQKAEFASVITSQGIDILISELKKRL